MLSYHILNLMLLALSVRYVAAAVIRQPDPIDAMQNIHVWGYNKSSINVDSPVAPDEVRRSHKYEVSVSLAGANNYQSSFVYETIPRNGNGKMYDPAEPGVEYDLADGDGITIEADAGINMAWSQFEYNTDADVRITSTDGSELCPESNIVIRPTNMPYNISCMGSSDVVIRVPYVDSGHRFSVEFQNNLYAYHTNGTDYTDGEGLIVSEEPRDALLIFASPFIPENLIPSKTSPDTQVLQPGKIINGTIGAKPTLYFETGVYWLENADAILGKSHIKLDPNTHYVYFEPGTYIKGAFEYTTSNEEFHTIGHGVVSGENYAYMANTAKDYVAEKDDRTSLRMFSHGSVTDNQTWTCMGPTLNAPPFNTVDLFPKSQTDHEEDNKVHSHISDYKQVGAFYFQTDGTQIYAGTLKDIFWHVNDDAIKLYHSNAQIERLTVWECRNDPVIQMGWKPRNVSSVVVDGLDIIHNRWPQSLTVVPSSIIGASPYYTDPKLVDSSRTVSAHIRNVNCEGRCAALFRIALMNNYDLLVENVVFGSLLDDPRIRLGQSLVGTKISDDEDAYVPGQEDLDVGIHVKNWVVGGEKVGAGNWRVDQLGQLNFNESFWGQWSIE